MDVRLTFAAQPERRVEGLRDFLISIHRNPLKTPDSEKLLKGNESIFAFISFAFLTRRSPLG
jgi:hypothetical protein